MGNKGGMLRFTLLVILTASSYAAITITSRQTESLNISIDIQRNANASNDSYIIKYGENPSTDKNITKSSQDVSMKKLEVILQNLRSGTKYKIEVIEVSNASVETLLANTTAYTEPGSPRNLLFNNVGTRQLDVTWDAPATGNFTGYNIQLESLNSSYNHSKNKNVSTGSTSFTGLIPGVHYRATVAAQLGTLQSVNVTAVDNTRPENPRSLSFSSTESSITVSWDKGDGISDGYNIVIDSTSFDNVSSTSKEFSDLSVGSSYVFTLKAYSGNRFSGEVTLNAWTKPAAPKNLTLSPNTRTNVSGTFIWHPPSNGGVDAYRIRLLQASSGSEINSHNITSLSKSFDGLYPGRLYTVEVRSAYRGALSTSSSVNFTTKPNRPSYLRVTAKTTSTITVKWSRGSGTESDGEVLSLLKDGQTLASENFSNEQTSKMFTNLISGETYDISVTTQSNGVQSDPVTITETTPPLAPEIFSVNGIGTTFVEVTWEYPENVTKDFLSLTISGSSLTRIVNITSDLSAYTERKYKFENMSTGQLYVVTLRFASDGVFGDNKTITVTTFPSSLAALDVENTTTTSITVGWNEVLNTTFDRYWLHILPNDGNADLPINVSRNGSKYHTFTGLYPGRRYDLSIQTVSGSSASEARSIPSTTNPLAVSSLIAKAIDTSNIQLNWTVSLNSTQDHFLIKYNGKLIKYSESTASGPKTYVLRNLKPGFAYNITVKAVSSLSYYSEDVTRSESTYPAPVSNLTAKTAGYTNISITWKIGIVNTLPSHQSHFRIRYRPVLRDINATPKERNVTVNSAVIDELYPGEKYDIQVMAEGKYRSESRGRTAYTYPRPPIGIHRTNNSETSFALRWAKAETYLTQYKIEYRALPPALNQTRQTKFTNGSEYVFTSLEPGVSHTVSIFAVTDDVESPDSTTGNFTTRLPKDSSNVVAVVVSILVVILLVGVLVGVLIYLRRRGIICKEKDEDEMTGSSKLSMSSLRHSLRRLSHRGKRPADKASHLVRLEEFPDFVKMMSKDSDFGYSEEYEDLKEVGRNQPWDEAEIPHNRGKNRFTNILPYDHSRVKLLPTDDEDGSDYINANYMPGFSSMREYIVTQGPLPSTVDDFWRMVWEQNCRAIVMLTKCVEKGREKCHQYWPSDSEPAMYGDLQVTILNETRTPEWNISEFKIAKGEQARNIRHFHYTAWPDFGVPTRPQSLIKFVRTVREKLPKEGGPIVVHCSAGVGRSGTFIVLDRLMQHIKDHDSVDIYGVVHQMRGFRVYMVQTEAQYICIHQCLLCVLEGREDEDMNYSEGMSNMGFEGTKLKPPTSPIESAPLIPEKGQDDEGITVEVT